MLCCLGSLCGLPGLGILAAIIWFFVVPKIKEKNMEKRLARWNNTPKDVVIMHAVSRGRTVSHPSPFVVKLETFLRMAKIRYETDFGLKNAYGPKGRFPWISLNGQHLADSELIIQFLTKKFEVKLGSTYTPKELALGGAVRIMMDDHFFWGLVLNRFAFSSFSELRTVMRGAIPSWIGWIFKQYASRAFINRSKGHGMGLHNRQEIEQFTLKDLRNLSEILGKNKFVLGEEPSEVDCTVFGHLAQAMWGLPNSPYENAMKNELHNLREYCIRMKERFYPDWNDILDKAS